MKVLLDTSVLVAAMVEAHPHHGRALSWIQRAKRREVTAIIASHSLAELYAILTSLPLRPRIPPATAWQLIQQNVLDTFTVVSLSDDDYRAVLKHLSTTGIVGGATYDALIAHAASKVQVDHLVTFNAQDFRRVYPDLSDRVIEP